MKKIASAAAAILVSTSVFAQKTGVSSSQSPFYLPKHSGVQTMSLLTVGDSIGGYKMIGIPDGLGARRDSKGKIELYMNHELGATQGIVRAHGSAGAFVSKWTIDPKTKAVTAGSDLITIINNAGNGGAGPFGRFCSANLAKQSAFYNPSTGLGTKNGIYMTGEEVGTEGRAFGILVSGPNSGTASYLASLGRFSYENSVAHESVSDKTIVASTDDASPGQVYFYEGTKTKTGDDFMKAGLVGGKTYGLALENVANEITASGSTPIKFKLMELGDAAKMTGAELEAASTLAGVTQFARPEDFAWDPTQPKVAYFATTGTSAVSTKLWKMTFHDIKNISLGGQMTAVLDTSDGIASLDNLCVDKKGNVIIQEDPGSGARLAKIWHYNPKSGALNEVASADPARFLTGGTSFLTQNEESSGIIDASDFLGKGWFIFDVQAHYDKGLELVQGGQLMAMKITNPAPRPGK